MFSILQVKESQRKVMLPKVDVPQDRSALASNSTSGGIGFNGVGRAEEAYVATVVIAMVVLVDFAAGEV